MILLPQPLFTNNLSSDWPSLASYDHFLPQTKLKCKLLHEDIPNTRK